MSGARDTVGITFAMYSSTFRIKHMQTTPLVKELRSRPMSSRTRPRTADLRTYRESKKDVDDYKVSLDGIYKDFDSSVIQKSTRAYEAEIDSKQARRYGSAGHDRPKSSAGVYGEAHGMSAEAVRLVEEEMIKSTKEFLEKNTPRHRKACYEIPRLKLNSSSTSASSNSSRPFQNPRSRRSTTRPHSSRSSRPSIERNFMRQRGSTRRSSNKAMEGEGERECDTDRHPTSVSCVSRNPTSDRPSTARSRPTSSRSRRPQTASLETKSVDVDFSPYAGAAITIEEPLTLSSHFATGTFEDGCEIAFDLFFSVYFYFMIFCYIFVLTPYFVYPWTRLTEHRNFKH